MQDTLIAGFACQILSVTKHIQNIINETIHSDSQGEFYTNASEGIVSIWTGSVFDTLLNYSAVPGDQWEIPYTEGILIVVTDTGHVTIDDQWLSYLTVQPMVSGCPTFMPDTIYERIGPVLMYIDLVRSFFTDYAYGSLRCYSDDEMSYSRVDGPCSIALDTRS